MSPAPTRPQQRDAERSRSAILDAAERLFADHGVEGASLQAIGAQAGVSRGLPNYLFGTKEKLYQATLERLLQAEHAAVVRAQELIARADLSSEELLRVVIRSHLEFLRARPAFLKLIARESLRGGVGLRVADNYFAVLEAGRALIEREQARGGIAPGDPQKLLMHILALCWFPFIHGETVAGALGSVWAEPDFVEAHTESVVRLLFQGVQGPDGVRAEG